MGTAREADQNRGRVHGGKGAKKHAELYTAQPGWASRLPFRGDCHSFAVSAHSCPAPSMIEQDPPRPLLRLILRTVAWYIASAAAWWLVRDYAPVNWGMLGGNELSVLPGVSKSEFRASAQQAGSAKTKASSRSHLHRCRQSLPTVLAVRFIVAACSRLMFTSTEG